MENTIKGLTMIPGIKNFGKTVLRKTAPGVFNRLKDLRDHPLRDEIDRILARQDQPRNFDTWEIFKDLQSRYPVFPKYGYDPKSVLERGLARVKYLKESIPALAMGNQSILEVGSGDSMVSFVFSQGGHKVTAIDKEDWRDARAKNVIFIKTDLSETLPVNTGSQDICFSFNAFEHIERPDIAFVELVRILKPGGFLYLDFNPLYFSPWGMHLYRSLRMPYCQYLFSLNYIFELKKKIGVNDIGQVDEPLQPLNRWKAEQLMTLWRENAQCEVIFCETSQDQKHLNIVKEFSPAFQGRGLTYDDVITSGIKVLIRKK